MSMNESNNEQLLNIETNKQRNSKYKTIIEIFAILLLIIISLVTIYKTKIDISDKFTDRFDYDFSEINIVDNDNFLQNISYDMKNSPNTLSISIPKLFIYGKLLKINELRNNTLDRYDVEMKRIGFISNTKNSNYFDYSIDCTYKKIFDFYLNGSIEYQITDDNGIELILRSMNIGKLPNFLYSSKLPYHVNDTIYEIKSENYILLKEKVLRLDLVTNIEANKESIDFDYNFIDNVDYIIEKIFGDSDIRIYETFKEYMPFILNSIINDNNGIGYTPKKEQ